MCLNEPNTSNKTTQIDPRQYVISVLRQHDETLKKHRSTATDMGLEI